MSVLLKLDSTGTVVGVSDDFVVEFPSPIDLTGEWELSLIKANLWYAWYNISAEKGNNIVRYYNGTLFRPNIVIPDGQYTLDQLNDFIQSQMNANGDFTLDTAGQPVYDIIIEPNFSTLRTNITLTNGYQLDLTLSDLYLLLGFTQILVTTSGDGPFVANINDSINSLIIHCDLVSGNASYANSTKSDILFSFVPDSIPGTNIDVTPLTKIYLPIDPNRKQVSEVRMYLTDNLDRRINLNGEPATYLLHVRPIAR